MMQKSEFILKKVKEHTNADLCKSFFQSFTFIHRRLIASEFSLDIKHLMKLT